jgi:hypothetical protein
MNDQKKQKEKSQQQLEGDDRDFPVTRHFSPITGLVTPLLTCGLLHEGKCKNASEPFGSGG